MASGLREIRINRKSRITSLKLPLCINALDKFKLTYAAIFKVLLSAKITGFASVTTPLECAAGNSRRSSVSGREAAVLSGKWDPSNLSWVSGKLVYLNCLIR